MHSAFKIIVSIIIREYTGRDGTEQNGSIASGKLKSLLILLY